ncbi:MAG: DUF4293 family protein [Fluviicola sp.]
MLQRLQTLYFFIATVLVLVPIFGFTIYEIQSDKGLAIGNAFETIQNDKPIFQNQFYLLIIIAVLILQLVIFSYKNRQRQIFLSWIVFVFILFSLAWMYIGMNANAEEMAFKGQKIKETSLDWPVYVFGVSIFFVMQGLRLVRKDKKLVDSLNRLR